MRYRVNWSTVAALVVVALLVNVSCAANRPPNLSPPAKAAFVGTQAIQGLDLLRDTAISASQQQPPLVSDAAVKQIVEFHLSAIKTIHETPNGWKPTVSKGLAEAFNSLSAKDRAIIAPYVALVRAIFEGVSQP